MTMFRLDVINSSVHALKHPPACRDRKITGAPGQETAHPQQW